MGFYPPAVSNIVQHLTLVSLHKFTGDNMGSILKIEHFELPSSISPNTWIPFDMILHNIGDTDRLEIDNAYGGRGNIIIDFGGGQQIVIDHHQVIGWFTAWIKAQPYCFRPRLVDTVKMKFAMPGVPVEINGVAFGCNGDWNWTVTDNKVVTSQVTGTMPPPLCALDSYHVDRRPVKNVVGRWSAGGWNSGGVGYYGLALRNKVGNPSSIYINEKEIKVGDYLLLEKADLTPYYSIIDSQFSMNGTIEYLVPGKHVLEILGVHKEGSQWITDTYASEIITVLGEQPANLIAIAVVGVASAFGAGAVLASGKVK